MVVMPSDFSMENFVIGKYERSAPTSVISVPCNVVTNGSFLVDATKTDGSGTDIANGDRWRISPQGYWYGGPVGVLVEYVRSSHDIRRGTNHGAADTFQPWSDAVAEG